MVALGGQGELQHDLLVCRDRLEALQDFRQHDLFGFGLVGDRNGDLGFDDRHEAMAQDLVADLELLGDIGGDAGRVCSVDHRPHLGAEDAF